MENKRRYFKGLEELNAPAAKEFLPNTPGKNIVEEEDFDLKSSRRDFLKFMGFGVGAAALAACTKTPVKKAIPYVSKPAEVDPGIPNYYASYFPYGDFGVIVKTREGRPIKVDGNNLCPISGGGSSAAAQASVLSLYDTGRQQRPLKGGQETDWETVNKDIYKGLSKISASNGAIALITPTIHSPSTLRAIDVFKQAHPGAKHVQYDAISYSGLRNAHSKVFGKAVTPNYHFNKAETIVSFGADFLGTWLSPVRFSRGYAKNRDVTMKSDMSYHVQFEGTLSLSGSKADLRVLAKSSEQGAKLVALYKALKGQSVDDEKIQHVAKELKASKGKSIVVCGINDTHCQVVAAEINKLLNNYGKTIDIDKPLLTKQGDDAAMNRVIDDVVAGNVKAVMVYGANPVYTHPRGNELATGLKNIELSISLNERNDETSKHCNYLCPDSHYLESWNDYNPVRGTYHLQQPAIQTIFDTRQAQESLLFWGKSKAKFYDFVRETWSQDVSRHQNTYVAFDKFWMQCLHDGVFTGSVKASSAALSMAAAAMAGSTNGAANGSDATMDATNVADTISQTSTERIGIREAVGDVRSGESNVREAVRDVVRGRETESTTVVESTEENSLEELQENTSVAATTQAATLSQNSGTSAALASAMSAISGGGSGYELELYQKTGILDGRDANNPWLLELPDAISKVSWDNYLLVSPVFASEQKWQDGDLVSITANEKTLENVPVLVMPGQKNGSFALAVGYGRELAESAGRVANGVGVNAFHLVSSGKEYGYHLSNVSITKTGSGYKLAKTQTHHHIQIPEGFVEKDQKVTGRRKGDIVKEMGIGGVVAWRDKHKANGHDADGHNGHDKEAESHGGGHGHGEDNGKVYDGDQPKKFEDYSLYPSWRDRNFYKAIHWGMTVNLNTCTGCNACVIACQAENNVPVVGKQEVMNRREMHWIRIDRYFATDERMEEKDAILQAENPSVSFQPLMCQHCDNAPCENVCPVNAINHSSEGINQQIYNRCMGTRYCANNCPYKVRRFNWFAYYDNDNFNFNMNDDYGRMVLNPDVTVRARGVMEKCTFCMQRIQSAKLKAKAENRGMVDGDVRTACQDACPTEAITFGDMNDPESKVSKVIQGDLSYRLVELLNTDNSVYYTTMVRNDKLGKMAKADAHENATEDAHHS